MMPAKKTAKTIAFSATNHHVAACGKPPKWAAQDSRPGHRRFYGENDLGEQIIAEVSREFFRFALGDAEWDNEIRVDNPDYAVLIEELKITRGFTGFRGMILNATECAILMAALVCGTSVAAMHRPAKQVR